MTKLLLNSVVAFLLVILIGGLFYHNVFLVFARVKYEKAQDYIRYNDKEVALKHLEESYEMFSTQDYINNFYSTILYEHDVTKSIEVNKEILQHSPRPNVFIDLGRGYLQQGQFDSAHYYFSEAHYAHSGLLAPIYWRAKTFYAENLTAKGDSVAQFAINLNLKVNSVSTLLMKEELNYLKSSHSEQ